MGKKKKFIDKKKSATFQLLARDSSDPNYNVGPSGDRVFVRVDNNAYSVNAMANEDIDISDNYTEDPSSIFADAPNDNRNDDGDWGFGEPNRSAPLLALPDHVRKEILELGFPDDGYNYLIHLREIKNTGGGSAFYHNPKAKLDQLPHDVKAYDASRLRITEVNEDPKSIYNVATKTVGVRIQKAVDPEVAALLDDNDLLRFGSDVEDLEEDFVVQANLPEDSELTEEYGDQSYIHAPRNPVVESSSGNDIRQLQLEKGDRSDDEKPRARRFLDEQFDLLELHEYGTDSENDYGGSLADEEESLALKLNDALKNHARDDMELESIYKVPADVMHANERPNDTETLDSAADVIQRCREYAEEYENENDDQNVVVLEESSDESEAWDCETIVSTYSNLENHPGKIEAPEITRKKKLAETVFRALNASNPVIPLRGKEKLPVEFLPGSGKGTSEKLKGSDYLQTEHKRRQHGQESKEEKKERKAAVKEERREARRVKKEMKGLYRCEAQRAQKVAAITGPSSIHLM